MQSVRKVNQNVVQQQWSAKDAEPKRLLENIPSPISHSQSSKSDERGLTTVGLFERSRAPKRHGRFAPKHAGDGITPWHRTRDRILGELGSGFLYCLLGPRGTGKTQIAVQAVMVDCGLMRPCRYAKAMDLFLDIKATYGREDICERDVIDEYRQPLLLVLDEASVRGETEWEDRMLVHLIDHRYDDEHDTLLLANMTPEQFRETMGPSISDRLRETGGVIECDWPSFRTKQGD